MRSNLYTFILQQSCRIFITIFIGLFIGGCSKENGSLPQSSEDYSLEHARACYLQNHTTVTLPEWVFQNATSTKSMELQSALTPNWKAAKTIKLPNRNLIRYEIPLNSPFSLATFLSQKQRAEITHTLVIEFETQTHISRQFIATLIGKQPHQTATYSSKKEKFRGFVLLSELNGQFIAGFHYFNGTRTAIKLNRSDSIHSALTSFWFGILPPQTKGPLEPTENKYCRECVSIQPFIGSVCQTCGLWSMGLQEVVVYPDKPDEGTSYCNQCFYSPCRCNRPNPDTPFRCQDCTYLYCSGDCQPTGGGGSGETPAEGEWWPGGHKLLLETALSKYMSQENLEKVIDGSRYADNGPGHQKPENAYMHAMRAPNQSRIDAIGEMKMHFNEHVKAFLSDENYHSLGRALHMIQDAYSPLHNFEIWDGSTLSLMKHIFTESIHFHQDPARAAMEATDRLYGEIYNLWKRWKLSHEIGEADIPNHIEMIFNKWIVGF